MKILQTTSPTEVGDENAGPTGIGTGGIHRHIATHHNRSQAAAASAWHSASDAKPPRNLITLFASSRMREVALDGRDVAILETLRRSSSAICATDAHQVVCENLGRPVPIAVIFRRFREMEGRGLIAAVRTAPSRAPDGRGRQRALYQMTEVGRRALRLGEVMADPEKLPALA